MWLEQYNLIDGSAEPMEKQVLVEEVDAVSHYRSGWQPFTDVFSNNYAYCLEDADEKDEAVLCIGRYVSTDSHPSGGFWSKFFSAPIDMNYFETEEEIADIFETLFQTPRYKFFARPKHLHYKGYQPVPVPVPEPEQVQEPTFNVFNHDEDDDEEVLRGNPPMDSWEVQEYASRRSAHIANMERNQSVVRNQPPSLWQRIRGNNA